eukprot:294760-Amphidinium_carterae.1
MTYFLRGGVVSSPSACAFKVTELCGPRAIRLYNASRTCRPKATKLKKPFNNIKRQEMKSYHNHQCECLHLLHSTTVHKERDANKPKVAQKATMYLQMRTPHPERNQSSFGFTRPLGRNSEFGATSSQPLQIVSERCQVKCGAFYVQQTRGLPR